MADVSHRPVAVFLEEIKFGHSIFALPFAGLAAFMAAEGWPGGVQLGLIVWCMVAARTFAMAANRLIDRDLDAANPRTAGRAIASGRLSVRFGIVAVLASAAAFLLGCGGFLLPVAGANPWPLWLGGPTLLGLAGYSYIKRFSALCHVYLGLAIAFAPLATWIAINPATLGWPAGLLTAAVACWIAGFDVLYALQDRVHDVSAGLFSIPAKLGEVGALLVSRVLHAATVVCLVALGFAWPFGWVYAAGVVLVAGLLIYEQSLVRPGDLSRINLAFFTVNGVVSLVMGILGIIDILL